MGSTQQHNGGAAAAAPPAADPIDLSRLAAYWRPGAQWDEMVARADDEEAPTHLNTVNSSGGFNAVSTDKLSVQYSGVRQHGHDVGVVQANRPAPTKKLVYYFEMTVKNAGAKGYVAIGFTPPKFKMCRQPGWEPNSCGYHGDDGHIYCGLGKGEKFGPKFTTDDTIGAGINYATQEFFFTKNGELVGSVSKNMKVPLFPTVAVHSQNEEISVNFGKNPFLFNIEAFESEQRKKQQSTIDRVSLQVNLSHWLVRSYLLHYGYEDTLLSFDSESTNALPPVSIAQDNTVGEQGENFALSNRKILRQLIRSGQIDQALKKLDECYPQVLQYPTSTVCFLLHCQRFIEYIRGERLQDAVMYAREQLAKFFAIKSLEPILKDCVALLAYEDPSCSDVGYLLDPSQREIVADAVNAVVLSLNANLADSNSYMQSNLEKLLRQLTVCCLERRFLNGDQGEAFHLHTALHSNGRRS